MTRTATCACGRASISVDGAPVMHGACHCANGKRRTGRAFGLSVHFGRAAVVARSGRTSVHAFGHVAQRHAQRRHFRACCGTTLFGFVSTLPQRIGIAGGCFASDGEPGYSVSDAHRAPWLALPVGWRSSP